MKILEKWVSVESYIIVGKNISRVDALDKIFGRAMFTEDYFVDYVVGNALFVKQVLSTYPHARIKSIDCRRALKVPGVVRVITARDIPGENQVGYAIPDQPLLAEGKVRYPGEVVALVAAVDFERAFKASEEVSIHYEPLPYVLDPLEAMRRTDILVHEERGSNIAFTTHVRKGNVEEGFSKAQVVVENEYRLHHQEHMYLETEAALAIPESEGRITVIGTIQYPHLGQRIVARVLGVPANRVKVVAPYIGGGFGGKDDEGPLVCAKAALVAYLTGKPAFLIYSREDSIRVHPKREAAIIRYKSGADANGKLTAIDVTIVHDTGAYANRAPFILWRATMHASGPYEVPRAKVDGYAVYTNKVYQGSFRGFGNLSIQFAVERQMDLLAEKLGLDPVEFRLKNILREGSYTLTNQLLDHSVGVAEALKRVAEIAEWWKKREEYKKFNESSQRFKRGIGVAVGWHGISTSRAVPDWSNAYIKIELDGSVTVYTGIVEMGQGSPVSSHAQIVSEILGVPLELVRIVQGSTEAPDAGATHASRGTGIGGVGVLVEHPNTLPPVEDSKKLLAKAKLLESKAYVDFALLGVLHDANISEFEDMIETGAISFKVFMGPTTGNIQPPSESTLYEIMEKSAKTNTRVMFHAEDHRLVEYFTGKTRKTGRTDPELHIEARPPLVEVHAIVKIASIAKHTSGHAHIVHVSSLDAIEAIKLAREWGADITAETCPHYLLLDINDYKRHGALIKVNPPIRGGVHREALLRAVMSGFFETIGSDHAPHTPEEKNRVIWDAAAGFPGVQTLLPLMLDLALRGVIPLTHIPRLLAENPAKLFNLWPYKGALIPGSSGDLVIIDPNSYTEITSDWLEYKYKLSPYIGLKLRGRVKYVILRGHIVVRNGELTGKRVGVFLKRVLR